jgi:hypothetical protein
MSHKYLKVFFLLVSTIIISGCVSNPSVPEPKPGVTLLSSEGVYKALAHNIMSSWGATTKALNMASNHCENTGKELLIQSHREWYTPFPYHTGRSSVIFACLSYGDKDPYGYRIRSTNYHKQQNTINMNNARIAQEKETQDLLKRSVIAQEKAAKLHKRTLRNTDNIELRCKSSILGDIKCSSY